MDIELETWQSAPALMWTGIDNDQWLGQWDVSLRAQRLSNDTKISSTTIMLEGRRRTFHVWRACESAQDGNSDLEHPSIITPIVLLMEISKDGSDSDGWCSDLWHCFKPYSDTPNVYIWAMYPLAWIFCSSLFMSLAGWIQSHVSPYS